MTKNKIEDLRDHLFAALEGLADKDDPMELDRAKAIAGVAQTIINSAKVEVDFLKTTQRAVASAFFPAPESRPSLPGHGPVPALRAIEGKPQ